MFRPGRDRPQVPYGEPPTADNLLWHRLLTRDVLAADDEGGGLLRRELTDLLTDCPDRAQLVPEEVMLMLGARPDDTTNEDEEQQQLREEDARKQQLREEDAREQQLREATAAARVEVALAEQRVSAVEVAAAQQQRYREEEAARQAERERLQQQAVLAEYAARDCPCCPGDGPENRTVKEQELINFCRDGGIQCAFDDDGNQISASFHPQELFNELSIHLANNLFNDYNTEEVVRWKIQYLYNHVNREEGLRADGLEAADWQRTGLAMGDYDNGGDDDSKHANVD